MSPANKFWLGLLSIIILLLCISSKFFFYTFLLIYIVVGFIIFLTLNQQLIELYDFQDEYLREQQKEKSSSWFTSYKSDKSEEIAKKEFYIKISYVYWILFAIRSFNNYLNNKFSKNE